MRRSKIELETKLEEMEIEKLEKEGGLQCWPREQVYDYVLRRLNRLGANGQTETSISIAKKSGWSRERILAIATCFRRKGAQIPTTWGSLNKFVEKAKIEHPECFEK